MPPRNWVEKYLESGLFTSRWLLAPFYVGLVIALAMLLIVFVRELVISIPEMMRLDAEQMILSVLTLIDLSLATPAWTALPDMNVPRPEQFTATLLPDGKVFIAGGVPNSPGPAEIFDPNHPSAGWLQCPGMKYIRGYHSSNILLADGSVLIGGDPPSGAGPTCEAG